MIALSTSWNAWRYSRAEEIISEIKALGFTQVELNFNLTPLMVKEMILLKKRGLIKVVSLHNFCPLPYGVSRKQASPDIFSLSALDEQERLKAITYTQRSILTAARIGAQVVILHLGRVKMKERLKKLALLYRNGSRESYRRLKIEMQKERQERAKRFFTQALRSLEQLCAYAKRCQVYLGIENRFYFSEIPALEEMEELLCTFPAPPLYYWHDVGHAQVYENLALIQHKTFLDKFSKRMIGIHLHDIQGTHDHYAPLKGNFDFTLLKPYVRKKTFKVMEPHYPATGEEIIRAKVYLERLFGK